VKPSDSFIVLVPTASKTIAQANRTNIVLLLLLKD
jgi:hypothetical protein